MRNEIEAKRNEINRNEIHRNETKFTEMKRNRNEIDRNETKRNNSKWNKTYYYTLWLVYLTLDSKICKKKDINNLFKKAIYKTRYTHFRSGIIYVQNWRVCELLKCILAIQKQLTNRPQVITNQTDHRWKTNYWYFFNKAYYQESYILIIEFSSVVTVAELLDGSFESQSGLEKPNSGSIPESPLAHKCVIVLKVWVL
jgi:hypothetical protein